MVVVVVWLERVYWVLLLGSVCDGMTYILLFSPSDLAFWALSADALVSLIRTPLFITKVLAVVGPFGAMCCTEDAADAAVLYSELSSMLYV